MDAADKIKPEIIIAENPVQFADIASDFIAGLLEKGSMEKGHIDIGLSGGSTPLPVYEKLASPRCSNRIAWESLDFYFSDERCVSPDSPDSNFQAVEDALLEYEAVRSAQIHRIPAEDDDKEKVADEYASMLPDHLDILLLGMGTDGHLASIFPGSKLVDETDKKVAVVNDSPKPPSCRITITPSVIENAVKLVMLVIGDEKAEMVSRAIEGEYDPHIIPAQLALRGTWILDKEAASRLGAASIDGAKKP